MGFRDSKATPLNVGSCLIACTPVSALKCFVLSACAPTKQSILLVEDQENDIILTKLALQRCELSLPVYSVPGGLEAIAYLNGDPPYQDRSRHPLPLLVLMDVRLPRMDGFGVLKWIRSQSGFDTLPVVMLTGSTDIRDADMAFKLGATSFLVKSTDFTTELSRTVDRLISRETGV